MSDPLTTLTNRYKQFAPDPDLHGSYYPADVYPGEAIAATVRATVHGEDISESARIWRISPLGLELIIGSDKSSLLIGQVVDIDLRLGTTVTSLSGLTI